MEGEMPEKKKEIDTENENEKEKVLSEAEMLPKAIVRRVVKDKLSHLSTDFELSVLRDSLEGFSESARIFIHYLSATANDICKESNRQVINAEDVFKALEEIDFSDFIEPLRISLEEFRQKNVTKRSGSSKGNDTNKKAKRKGSHVESEGRKKQREDAENNEDGGNADETQ
ncbi:hypothetical protein ACJIZ3_017373 [Penstemon smallii]|uniref:Transcription factor CBF/NF-Y/archaeal histone domain-containing protein n=1 Tax=Penstemon smallii TaxID=265156 RepID=A0ABD3SVY3_9LAMI